MKKSDKIEWFLRIVTFGLGLAVGIIGAWNVWAFFKEFLALLLFILAFVIVFSIVVYIVWKRKLRMLQT